MYELINHPDFLSGKTDIDFIERVKGEKEPQKKAAPAKKRKTTKKK